MMTLRGSEEAKLGGSESEVEMEGVWSRILYLRTHIGVVKKITMFTGRGVG